MEDVLLHTVVTTGFSRLCHKGVDGLIGRMVGMTHERNARELESNEGARPNRNGGIDLC